MIYQIEGKGFWLDEVADAFLGYLEKRGIADGETLTLAAGMTPSCPIHFGIFREIAISHFVAEELKRRGRKVRLVFYWDDFDHFCKIPYFTTKSQVRDFIGRPLCEVPDLNGEYGSYGGHYMDVFERDLKTLGIEPEYDYQSRKYLGGAYAGYVRQAVRKRRDIFDIINEKRQPYDEKAKKDREDFFPLEVYCGSCRRDSVAVKSYDEAGDEIEYECRICGHEGKYRIGGDFFGKLIWKANWATRWHDDGVVYESSGENQLTKTGSYAVSSRIVSRLYGGEAPFSLLYRFIGVPGAAKVSRAMGEKGLSTRLTDLLEPAVVRWLLLRNPPDKPFSIDLDGSLERIYHEWDCFLERIGDGRADGTERRVFALATSGVPYCPVPIPFRAMLVAIGISNGDEAKAAALLKRICGYKGTADELRKIAFPRFRCAVKYVFKYGNGNEAPVLLKERNSDAFRNLSRECREAVLLLSGGISSCATEDEVLALLRRIPADVLEARGAESGNGGADGLRKEFYRGLYVLLVGKEKGPKLSTLIHLAGPEAVSNLIKGEAIYEHIRYRVG